MCSRLARATGRRHGDFHLSAGSQPGRELWFLVVREEWESVFNEAENVLEIDVGDDYI